MLNRSAFLFLVALAAAHHGHAAAERVEGPTRALRGRAAVGAGAFVHFFAQRVDPTSAARYALSAAGSSAAARLCPDRS